MHINMPEIAVNRFGMGARRGDIDRAKVDPLNWLLNQIRPIKFDTEVGNFQQVELVLKQFRLIKQQIRNDADVKGGVNGGLNGVPNSVNSLTSVRRQESKMVEAMGLELLRYAMRSEYSLSVRLLDFFSNHFSVTGQGPAMTLLAPLLEREALAPHLAGNFSDMLLAVEQHPAMIMYLNNEKSFGPNSKLGRHHGKGLNENLAREILELHTLGVAGGYSQNDVRELAKGITGWSVNSEWSGKNAGFVFRNKGHEPGIRIVLGKSYSPGGLAQGEAILKDLALHPSTARHLSFKLAQHFVTDLPSAELVNNLTASWLDSKGHIPSVMRALFRHPESWNPLQHKLKTPREFVISSLRILDSFNALNIDRLNLFKGLSSMGQEPMRAGSPSGYGDTAHAWDGAEALMTRIDWASFLASYVKAILPSEFLLAALGGQVSKNTQNSIENAESRRQGLVLALMSPEFQRR